MKKHVALHRKIDLNLHLEKRTSKTVNLLNVTETYSINIVVLLICDVLRGLVPFVQFKKREKHPWRSVTCSKVAG